MEAVRAVALLWQASDASISMPEDERDLPIKGNADVAPLHEQSVSWTLSYFFHGTVCFRSLVTQLVRTHIGKTSIAFSLSLSLSRGVDKKKNGMFTCRSLVASPRGRRYHKTSSFFAVTERRSRERAPTMRTADVLRALLVSCRTCRLHPMRYFTVFIVGSEADGQKRCSVASLRKSNYSR